MNKKDKEKLISYESYINLLCKNANPFVKLLGDLPLKKMGMITGINTFLNITKKELDKNIIEEQKIIEIKKKKSIFNAIKNKFVLSEKVVVEDLG